MNHDLSTPVSAVALLLVIAIVTAVLLFRRRRPEKALPATLDPMSNIQNAAAPVTIPPPAPAPLPPVPEPTADRPRCMASIECKEPPVHYRPRFIRSDGIADFIRRAFGAPRRYRLADGAPGGFRGFLRALGVEDTRQSEAPQFCDSHIHFVRQLCREHLAADDHREQQAQRQRELELGHFESRGLLDRVQTMTREIEGDGKGRRRPRVVEASAQVVQLPSNGRSNGTTGASPN